MSFFKLILLIIGILSTGITIWQRGRLYRSNKRYQIDSGGKEKRPALKEIYAVISKRFAKDKTAELLHHGMIIGILLIILSFLLLLGQTLGRLFGSSTSFTVAPGLISNTMAFGQLLIFCGVTLLMLRRFGGKVRRLEKNLRHLGPLVLIWLILLIGFLLGGMGAALKQGHAGSNFVNGAVAAAMSGAVSGLDRSFLTVLNQILNWLFIGLIFTLLVIFPRSKLYHMLIGLQNLLNIRSFQLGRIKNNETQINHFFLDEGNALDDSSLAPEGEEKAYFGLRYIDDMSPDQLLQLDDCVACGRCDDVCPAFLSGKSLSPQQLIRDHKHLLNTYCSENKQELIPNQEAREKIWDCNLCHACDNACPLAVEHVDKIIGLRRNMVLNEGDAKKEIKDMLRNLAKTGNPFGFCQVDNRQILRELEIPILAIGDQVDYLLWPGCYGLFDERVKTVLLSLVRLLRKAGKTFAVLEESARTGARTGGICCGDPARRVGEEHLFQTIMHQNMDLFEQYGVAQLLTICPHCHNSFKNEYPTFGAKIKAAHYLEVLPSLLNTIREDASLPIREDASLPVRKKRLFYHDSCYLGRINGLIEEPRRLIVENNTFELVAIGPEKEDSLCCGGGGGRIWVEEPLQQRPAALKLGQLDEKRIDLLITSCPFCLSIYSDTALAKNMNIEVKDLLEII